MRTAEAKTPASTKTIHIERSFAMPLMTLWKYWSDSSLFMKWWGPTNYSCPECKIDFRVGGKYLAAMMDLKSKKTMWSTGTYKEIIPNEKIVFTDSFSDESGNVISGEQAGMPGSWPGELTITLLFEETNGKSKFTLKETNFPLDMYEDCIKGWQESFDKLENCEKH